jgi:hypothetical protein
MKLQVKQGQHDFKPSIIPWPRMLTNKVLYFEYTLTESCWYDSLGNDNYDFNKGVGLFQFLDFAKNFNAFMLAWRPKLDERFSFEVVPYENRDKAILANEDKIRIHKAGDTIKGYFKPSRTGMELYLILEDTVNVDITLTDSLFFQDKQTLILWHKSNLSSCLYGVVDSWFGGNNVSPQDMEAELIINFTKLQHHVV